MSNNYEKVLLGGAAVVAIGVAFLGWRSASTIEDELLNPPPGGGTGVTAVRGAEEVAGAASSFASPHVWRVPDDDGRDLDLFVGPPLFVRDGSKDPVDLWKGEPVHPPIDNRWWLTHRIDCTFEDAPQRDPDGDGYSNLEEFEGKTDPADPRSHPELIQKLAYLKDNSYEWVLTFSGDFGPNQYQFKYFDRENPNGVRHPNPIGAGSNIFTEGPAKDRFKLLEVQTRKVKNERLNIEEDQSFAIIEDQKPNKKGDRFEVPRKIPRADIPRLLTRHDRKAVFELRAAGLAGKQFEVEEKTKFALPPEGTKKDFFLKEVTPDGVVIEWTDAKGEARSVKIPKGGLPQP